MKEIRAVNVDEAYMMGMRYLHDTGVVRSSRYGDVIVAVEPVTTHYSFPRRRVLMNAKRDANPFFHLFESLWMLSGANDVAPMSYFVKRMASFSDDGITFHGAYGHRWRHFRPDEPTEYDWSDQLTTIIQMLKKNPDDRRIILQMWDPERDLNRYGKDFPCNVTAKFEVGVQGFLNMVVFNRSNDIIWGTYGANAVHFSVLLEYVAAMSGYEMGWYEQVSSNYHAYKDVFVTQWPLELKPMYMDSPENFPLVGDTATFDAECATVVQCIRDHKYIPESVSESFTNPFFTNVCAPMLLSYMAYRRVRSKEALQILNGAINTYGYIDWLVAGLRWMQRRHLTNVG